MEENTSLNSIDFLPTSYHGKNILKRLNNQEKHSELFRKDLISAMKMADSETLQPDDYLEIIDSWKLEWERGVQVPVNANAFVPIIRCIQEDVKTDDSDQESYIFSKKLLYSGSILDDSFKPLIHEPYDLQKEVGSMCRYDLDELDLKWLQLFNQSQDRIGERILSELETERIMEDLEVQCNAKMNEAVRTVEGLGIEYDENVVCDICRSPEGEESNEMVFCDNCDICVHQACYGIQKIPDGSWLCRTCALGIKPKCALCPMAGGAMKSTKNGDKWAHISCALWVPEVSIGCPEKMEPITNLTQIPASRWALICTLCRERSGACIQCSVKSCKTSFHVTCAFKYSLDLSTVIDEETEDVQMKAYCPKHSGIEGAGSSMFSGGCAEDDEVGHEGKAAKEGTGPDRKSKRNKDGLTEEQRTEIRSLKLRRLAEEFYKFADAREVSRNLGLPMDVVNPVLFYWTLKRKSRFDSALMPVKTADEEEGPELHQGEEKLIERMKMFIQLRQDLERVRNLCYMVNKREKTRKHLYRIKEEIFHRQALLLAELVDEYEDDASCSAEGALHVDLSCPTYGGSKVLENSFAAIGQPAFRSMANAVENGFKNFPKKQNFRLSDSDDDDDDEEYSRILNLKKGSSSSRDADFESRVSKCLRINYSDDDDDYDDYTFDANPKNLSCDDEPSKKVGNARQGGGDKKKMMSRDRREEKAFLMSAHRSTRTVYDHPSYILSCSFKDNSALNNDRSFMKSAASATSIFGMVDDDDDDEIFPKSFKYDMKIDDDYVDSIGSAPAVAKPGRGRPRKNKRPPLPPAQPPPPLSSRPSVIEFEEDDSDYYRRLSDEDFEEELLKFTPVKPVKTPPEVTAPPAEKKKRGRKRKSDLVVASSVSATEKNKNGRQRSDQTPSTEPARKRKYTRRKKATEALKDDKNVYTPSLTSSPTQQSFQDDSNNFEVSVGSVNQAKDVNFSPVADNNDDDESIGRKRFEPSAGGISCDFSDEEDEETRARRSRAAELLKDMEMSDSCTEEDTTVCDAVEPDSEIRTSPYGGIVSDTENFEIKSVCSVAADNPSPDVLEMTLSPVELECFNPEKEDNECPAEEEKTTAENATSAPSTPHRVTVETAPLLETSFSVNLPSSPLFSSSSDDDESDNDFLGDRSVKNDSKVTGVINKERLNINAKRKLLHELPVKDFIVSSHIKNMVQNFFSNLGSTAVASAAATIPGAPDAVAEHVAPKLAFNGFKIPQGKINC